MKHLVIGAGATVAEAHAQGCPREAWPPVIGNFARTTWADYSPSPILDVYLKSLGLFEPRSDLRELFYELETAKKTDIERFMEFVWNNRDLNVEVGSPLPAGFISDLGIGAGGFPSGSFSYWENLLYHGIGRPLADAQMNCFYESGVGYRQLTMTQAVASHFSAPDLVLNLNYDTVFEVALMQMGQPFVYAPNAPSPSDLLVCKPHGSLNMISNDEGFCFGDPENVWVLPPPGYKSYSGLVPPRLHKQYQQHPIAEMILSRVQDRRPATLVLWGVGLTDSDTDLLTLYRSWALEALTIDIINPDQSVAQKARELLGSSVRGFTTLDAWTQSYR